MLVYELSTSFSPRLGAEIHQNSETSDGNAGARPCSCWALLKPPARTLLARLFGSSEGAEAPETVGRRLEKHHKEAATFQPGEPALWCFINERSLLRRPRGLQHRDCLRHRRGTGDRRAYAGDGHGSRHRGHPPSGVLCPPAPRLPLGYTALAPCGDVSTRRSPVTPPMAGTALVPRPRHVPERNSTAARGASREKGFSLCLLLPAAAGRSTSQALPAGDKERERHPPLPQGTPLFTLAPKPCCRAAL